MKRYDNAVFVPGAFNKCVDVRIGDWIRVEPDRLRSLLIFRDGDGEVDSIALYYNVTSRQLTDRIPLEFGGSDWEPVTSDSPQMTVLGFRNRFDNRLSKDPQVMEPLPLPPFAAPLELTLIKKKAADEARHRKEKAAEALSQARTARGLDPVFGNPVAR